MPNTPKPFVLGWKTKLANLRGDVELVGRPMSKIGLTNRYGKGQIKDQFGPAVAAAREITTNTRDLVIGSERDSILWGAGMGDLAPLPAILIQMSNEHFHINLPDVTQANAAQWQSLFTYLKQVYTLILQGIGGTLTIVDVDNSSKDDTNGSVSLRNARLLDPANADGLRIADRGRIHINFVWALTRTHQRVARTIIHEASHKFVGARDHAYKYNPAYASLTLEEAKTNADSIACFAYYLWKGGAFRRTRA
jgi:hypothetical protein